MSLDGGKIGGIVLSGAVGGIVAVVALVVMTPLTKPKPQGRAAVVHPAPVYKVDGDIRTLRVARSSDLSFSIVAHINGKPVRMLVDTGATITVLTRADADAVGIPNIETGQRIAVSGINKQISNYRAIGAWNIGLGPIALAGVPLAVDDSHELPNSILGQNAFCQVSRITIQRNILEFLNESPVAQGCEGGLF